MNKWGYVKRGKGSLQAVGPMDTFGFDLFDWDQCHDDKIKNNVCRHEIPMIESEMTTDTCMWDSKPKQKPKKKQPKRKQQQQQPKAAKNVLNGLINQLRTNYQQLTKSNNESRVYSYDDYSLFGEDIFNLQNDEWLSDSNIALFFSIIKNGFLHEIKSVMLLPPTFSFLLGNHHDPESLKDVMPSEIGESQVIFCAVNDNIDFDDAQGGSHWSLLVCLRDLGVCHGVDSMEGANSTEMKRLSDQFGLMFNKKFQYREVKNVPQQNNGSDCGVIVIAITMVYISRILELQSDEIVNWELDMVRVNPLACRVWMMESLRLLCSGSNKCDN